jgi:hypothetical protein
MKGKKKKKKHPYIYFWLPIWFCYDRLFDFFNKFENRGYISETGSCDCVREGPPTHNCWGVSVPGVSNNRTLASWGWKRTRFLIWTVLYFFYEEEPPVPVQTRT